MEIISDYRITALVSERELAMHAERARVAAERRVRTADRRADRSATATGSVACVPATSH